MTTNSIRTLPALKWRRYLRGAAIAVGAEAMVASVLGVVALANGTTGPGVTLLGVAAGAITISAAFWKWATKPKTGREKWSAVGVVLGALLTVGLLTGGVVELWLPGLFAPLAIAAALIAVIAAGRGAVKD